jgi:acetyl esterase/lipase
MRITHMIRHTECACYFVPATLCLLLCYSVLRAEKPDDVFNLWPVGPPGKPMEVGPEQDMTKDTDSLIAGRRIIKLGNVATPQAHVYLPPANLRTGASVVICPGGGFSILAWDLEGTEVAQWLNTLGVAGIVLKYRVPTRDHDPRWLPAAQDTQRTISLVRHHAGDWGLDADKVAVLGFSAGGMAALKTSLAKERFYEAQDAIDQQGCRPNRAILIYAAGLPNGSAESAPDVDAVTAETPPMFMVHAFDDFVPVAGTAHLLLALKRAGVPSDLHVYDAGGHGYGLRQRAELPVTFWTVPCEAWLRRAGWVD